MKRFNFFLDGVNLLFPFLLTFLLFVIIIETFTYLGFMEKILFVNSNTSFVLITIFTTFFVANILSKPQYVLSDSNKHFFSLILFFFPLLALLYISLSFLESKNYPNFVFSSYHIQLPVMQKLVAAYFFILVSYNAITAKKKLLASRYQFFYTLPFKPTMPFITIKFFLLVQSLLLLLFLVTNTVKVIPLFSENVTHIFSHPIATYDEKMKYNWKFFYEYMQYVKKVTPEDAVIALPPAQSHWLSTGNIVLVRYFLYPRSVVNLVETQSIETIYQIPPGEYSHMLLAQGLWNDPQVPYGWPKQQIPVEKIFLLNREEMTESIVQTSVYEPKLYEDTPYWGVLKLKEKSQQ